MTIYKNIFTLDSSAVLYRVDLNIESITKLGSNTGFSSIIFLKNMLPVPGACSLNNYTGFILTSIFTGNEQKLIVNFLIFYFYLLLIQKSYL